MGKIKRAAATVALTGVMVTVPAAAALAHECFVAKRSSTGTLNAAHSSRWFVLDLGEILQFEFGLDAETTEAILADLEAEGVPTRIALRTDKVLAEGTPHMTDGGAGDGKGVEHFFSGGYFDIFLEVLADHAIELTG